MRVFSRLAERLKTYDLSKVGKKMESPNWVETQGRGQSPIQKIISGNNG